MKRKIKTFFRSIMKRKQLKTVLGADISSLQKSIEQALVKTLDVREVIQSRYHDPGGLNNLGMFTHSLEHQEEPFAISKLQNSLAARREYRFQSWQENYLDNRLAAKAFLLAPFRDENYSWVTGEILYPVKRFSDMEIKTIFDKLNVSHEKLKELSIDRNVESLIYELEDNTRIKSVLLNLVSQIETEKAAKFTKKFLKERESLLVRTPGVYQRLETLFSVYFSSVSKADLSFMYGLVHGDFKKQNIMADEKGDYKVIDLQYFTYGIRIWDLAFYYSKDSRGFEEIYSELLHNFSWGKIERETFMIFYVIASILPLKNKNLRKTMSLKLGPAMNNLSASFK